MPRQVLILGGAGLLLAVAAGSAGCASTKTVPGPTVTVTQTRNVPGPTVTVTVTVSAPPPAPGTTIGKWSGTGHEATPAFNVPSSGAYIVIWSYYGNIDPSLGGGTNFAIQENGQGSGGSLPNDIAASGSGSTEITGAPSTDSFNVTATGHWTITVNTANG
jgi:hypothetical protein